MWGLKKSKICDPFSISSGGVSRRYGNQECVRQNRMLISRLNTNNVHIINVEASELHVEKDIGSANNKKAGAQ